ncbi:hypothetical protein L1987_56464 [Smallanthus sonchifolius]|uniref:Uncharacterized protein n=1 Tax=Smallanthus sonchifolius TaxID=185202 RepID=A0ACB9EDW7_9ASTR|nr:hypothetical protein L1987_56464 [Smallanthus sonchifolius]
MSTASIEVEVPSQFPAETVFKVFNNFHDITPKVNPQVFKSIEILEGDGGVGTIRLFTFGDWDNLMGILDSINHHVKIVPSADGGCVFKQTIIYNCKGDEKPSAEVLNFEKELYEKTYKAIEAYAVAHPEAY